MLHKILRALFRVFRLYFKLSFVLLLPILAFAGMVFFFGGEWVTEKLKGFFPRQIVEETGLQSVDDRTDELFQQILAEEKEVQSSKTRAEEIRERKERLRKQFERMAPISAKRGYRDIVDAAERGDVAALTEFLEVGFDANTKDPLGMRALEVAAMAGNAQITQLLLSHGADSNARGLIGTTPLMLAAGRGHVAVVKLLIENGADVNAKNDIGNTALKNASLKGHTEIVELLKQAGARE